MRTVYLDLETTGLDPTEDEILEIGILDDYGEVLLDSLVRPVRHRRWPKAQNIHGISPANVRDAPRLDALRARIVAAVADARVVIYNAPFDAGFLTPELEEAAEIRCAMRAFAPVYGEWSPQRRAWKWKNLGVAAAHVRFRWSGDRHRAIHDCMATRAVWRYLADEAERSRANARRDGEERATVGP